MNPATAQRRKGWTRVAFGDVVQLSRARSSDPAVDGFERYVGLEHLDPGDLKVRRWGNVEDGTTFTSIFRAGQVLFGKRRAYQRKVALADFDGVCSGDIYVLQAKNDHLLPELLPFICQTDGFFDHAIGTSAGSLSPRTNWKSLANYEFALPPLEEQRRIAEVLGAAQLAEEAIKTAASAAADTHRSLLGVYFPCGSKNADAWMALSEVAERVNDGTHQPPTFVSEGVPFLLVSNIRSGCIDWSVEKHVTTTEFEQLSRSWRPQRDDILYSLVGSYGVPAIVDRDVPFTFQRHIGIIRTKPDKLMPRFLYWYLMSPNGVQQAALRAEGLAQKTITLGALRAYRIPVPSLADQRRIVQDLDMAFACRMSLEDRAATINRISKELVQSHLGGAT